VASQYFIARIFKSHFGRLCLPSKSQLDLSLRRVLLQCFAVILLANPTICFADWGRNPTYAELAYYSKVSLGFATQDIKSPISIFGHTFLVFHNEEKPESDSLLVEFTGEAPDFLSGVSALVASVPGKYSLNYLSEKRRQYDEENRSLWLFRLNLSEDELQRLRLHLLQTEDIKHPYDFSQKNCAFYIAEALAKASNNLELKQEGIFVTPIATLRWARANNKISSATYLPSTQLKAIAEYDALSEAQQRITASYLNYAQPQNLSDKQIGSAISAITEHLIPREGDASKRNYLYSLKRTFPSGLKPIETIVDDPSRSLGSALLSVMLIQQMSAAIFSVSPGFVQLESESLSGQKNATIQFLKTELLAATSGSVRLEKFHLATIESNQPSGYLRDGFTQAFGISYTNYRTYLRKNYFENKLSFGRGASYLLGEYGISILPLGSAILFRKNEDNIAVGQIEMRLNIYKRLSENTVYAAQITHSMLKNSEIKQIANIDLVRNIGKQFSVSINVHRVTGAEMTSTLTGLRLATTF